MAEKLKKITIDDITKYRFPGNLQYSPDGKLLAFNVQRSDVENNWSGNYGHYKNDRIDEIIAAIPLTTDEAELKALYTEATEIYTLSLHDALPIYGLFK